MKDVAKAGFFGAGSRRESPSSRIRAPRKTASAAASSAGCDTGTAAGRIAAAFRGRIGAERHAVWFGDLAQIEVFPRPDGGASVVIGIGTGFTHDWLRKTFRAEFEAAVRSVCGPAADVVWQPLAGAEEAAAAPPGAGGAASDRPDPPVADSGDPCPRPAGRTRPARAARRAEPAIAPGQSPAGKRPAARLDAFVTGPSNRMAIAAVELVLGRPGEMSPLVLHGPSGVGKTHLLEAICGEFRERHPKGAAVYLTAEQFTTSFLQALHGSGLPGFRRTCRTADLLVVDDLQFFVGKRARATVEELHQTIEGLHRQGRQVVFACDREPESLTELGPDMLIRLRGGMAARMMPPDEEVRRGIVARIAASRRLEVPEDVVHYVASRMTRHARELVGAINRLEAASHMLGVPISLGMAEEALADLVRSSGRSVRLADIERAVCTAFGIETGTLQSGRRGKRVNHPRMLAMFLARKHTPAALAEIGSYFGRRSHSTVISAQKAVGEWMARREQIVLADTSWDIADAIRRVEDALRAG